MDLLDTLKTRGFVEACTDEDGVRALFAVPPATAYIGFDPTATSLHVGSLVQLMMMAHLQRAGHRVVALVGSGTARVGDPSGRTEMRRLLEEDELAANGAAIGAQIGRFVHLDGPVGLLEDNATWLLPLPYIGFLRSIGRHFSVNRMLAAESCRIRMEKGLSFLEFNYQVLQAYDFLELYRRHGCRLQMGGSDQWGNIVAGVDLIRRVEQVEVYGFTSPLVALPSGEKMGKSAQGAVWLDPALTPPFAFFQYWRNVPDALVRRFLLLFSFLPVSEVEALTQKPGAALNRAKERLAWEVTAIVHGTEAADQALAGARAAFARGEATAEVPTFETTLPQALYALLPAAGLCTSRSEARRALVGGAVRVAGTRVSDPAAVLCPEALGPDGDVLVWCGKKVVRVLAK
ncbi:MAG: tyrosine--tRNA ligase [Deltaproteobacteria bacterium]|nr:tyrosine--tRNA ligase [Deltaproteobacteria bacterium]